MPVEPYGVHEGSRHLLLTAGGGPSPLSFLHSASFSKPLRHGHPSDVPPNPPGFTMHPSKVTPVLLQQSLVKGRTWDGLADPLIPSNINSPSASAPLASTQHPTTQFFTAQHHTERLSSQSLLNSHPLSHCRSSRPDLHAISILGSLRNASRALTTKLRPQESPRRCRQSRLISLG